MRILVRAVVLSLLLYPLATFAALNPGDIAFVSMNTSGANNVAFVALRPINPGETIYFTDRGWRVPQNDFSSGETTVTWSAPGYINPGTLVTVAFGGFLSDDGDQVLAFQGNPGNPRFLAALNNTSPTGWQATATDEHTSALPAGLIDGFTAVAVPLKWNVRHDGLFSSGSHAELLASIHNPANWYGRYYGAWTLPPYPYAVSSGNPTVVIGSRADVDEASGQVTIPVYSATTGSHTVQVVVGNSTAGFGPGQDFIYASSSTVSFTSSQVAYVTLQIIDDTHCEGRESICLFLGNPQGCIASPRGVLFDILDNDGTPVRYFQGFEATPADNWTYTPTPAPYNSEGGQDPLVITGPEHVWARVKLMSDLFGPGSGLFFWGMGNYNSTQWHTIDFAPVSMAGVEHGVLRFRYITACFGATDNIDYAIAYDNGTSWASTPFTSLNGNTRQWVTVTAAVPAGAQHVRLRLRTQQCCQVLAGLDDVEVTGTICCALTASATVATHPSCVNSHDGAINLVVSQGQPPYSFQWGGPNGFTASTQNITGLAAGTYQVTVTDAGGCTQTAFATLTAPALNLTTTINPITCNGAHNGSVTTTVNGTNGPFSYQWTGPGGFTAATPSLSALGPGVYTLTVTDAAGCTTTATATLVNPDSLVLGAQASTSPCGYAIACNGGNTGTIDLQPTGGVTPYAYAWTGPNGFSATAQDLSGLVAGTYAVTVTDHNGCTATLSLTLTEPAVPLTGTLTAPLNGCGHHVTCNGGSDGQITLSGLGGGCPPYALQWTGPGGFTSTDSTLTGLGAGTYNLTVTDAAGCTLVRSMTLTQPDSISLTGQVTNASCAISMDGAIAITATGGCPGYTFLWTGPNGFSVTTQDLVQIPTGQYTLVVTDTMGCTATASFFVDVRDDLLATIGCCQDTFVCFGDTAAIRVDITGQGPWMLGYLEGTIPRFVHVSASPYYILASPVGTTQFTLTSVMEDFTDCPGDVCGTATIGIAPCDSSGCEDLCVNTGVVGNTVVGNCRTVTLEVACDTACTSKLPIQSGGDCFGLRTLAFNRLPNGSPIPPGTALNTQWVSAGILITVDNADPNHPDVGLAFGSHWPTGNEFDLGTPNFAFGGPGMGAGGGTGMPGQNDRALGNLLIIANNTTDNNFDGLTDDPEDDNAGGEIRFAFTTPRYVESLTMVDLNDGQPTLRVEQAGGAVTLVPVPLLGDNAVAEVLIQRDSVVDIRVLLPGEGAVASLRYCSPEAGVEYFDVSIPCGNITAFSNSLGLPMSLLTADPITGITGLRVEGLPAYCQDTLGNGPFTVSYTVCDTGCGTDFCLPMVAYVRGGCVQYEDAVNGSVNTPLPPNARFAPEAEGEIVVVPNPVWGNAHARFYLREAGYARLTLHDLSGKPQGVLWAGRAEAGVTYAAEVEAQGLAKGMYIVRLQSDGGVTLNAKMVVIK